jgi:hypothetical protein
MAELQAALLEELIELAYAERGYGVALSQEETDRLVSECVQKVEELSYPPASNSANGNQDM